MMEVYEEESLFCSECTEDPGLKNKIRQHGINGLCNVCEEEAEYAVRFDQLADWLERIWREWFHIGAERPVFYSDSDKPEYEQVGDEPELLIGEIIQCKVEEEDVTKSLIELMSRGDQYEVMQGGEPLVDDCQLYQKRKLDHAEGEERWNNFVLDLKHHTRYFNSRAIELFDKLFTNLNEIRVPEISMDVPLPIQGRIDAGKLVVREFEPGSLAVFRARKVGNSVTQSEIIKSPDTELSNPPDRLAAEGRMNPKGISYFYGAADRETCVAELRPSISEKIISSEFELIEPIRLLDLTLLSRAHHQRIESMFDDDYLDRLVHMQLLRQLHWLIAQPVLDGDEFEYLPTQAMSEYLARRTSPRVDGIIFKSVQREGGQNIVLFPHVLRNENHSAIDFMIEDSAIRIKPNTLVVHEVARIEHNFKDRKIVDGKPEMLPEDDFCDDDGWGYH
ncbi:RES domain-containing protein [Microbulbifer litoralis]|uniref:RES domain-containing protein n=1 Tax=Microbulbifer litoralis TaxID=2933965 RepID=UPI0020293555|nr:RES domain-containing protein [Microbulbifer sp. GX H0434]